MKRAMPRLLYSLALLALGSILFLGSTARADEDKPKQTIRVEGQATLEVEPDQVRLILGVETRAPKAEEAARENAQAMDMVLRKVKGVLGQAGQVETVGYRVSPRYEWDRKNQVRRFVGFEAVNQVQVTSSDTTTVGRVLDVALEAGANSISGPYWDLKDPTPARSRALVAALEDARLQAQALARAAGLELGPVLSIKVGGESGYARPAEVMLKRSTNASTPIKPGKVQVPAVVSCVYSLIPKP